MTNFLKVIVLVSALFLHGCQILTLNDTAQDDQLSEEFPQDFSQDNSDVKIGKLRKVSQQLIDEWVADKKYTRVLGALESVPESKRTKEENDQIDSIRKLAEEYDRHQSELITRLYNNDKRRVQALEMLTEAFNNYSDGSRLWAIKEKILQQQSNYVQEIESQILLAKGGWLLQSVPLYKEMLSVNPGNMEMILESKQNAGEIIVTAARLTVLGIHAISANEFQLAEQRLNMANALNPTSDNITALARLDQLSHEKNLKQREVNQAQEEIQRRSKIKKSVEFQRKKQEKELRESTLLVEKIYRSLAREELAQALAQIKLLENNYKGHVDILRLRTSLNKSITQKVDTLLLKGNELYSNGQIEKAKVVWELALKLDPENVKIKRRINRSKQVLNKLRELQNK